MENNELEDIVNSWESVRKELAESYGVDEKIAYWLSCLTVPPKSFVNAFVAQKQKLAKEVRKLDHWYIPEVEEYRDNVLELL